MDVTCVCVTRLSVFFIWELLCAFLLVTAVASSVRLARVVLSLRPVEEETLCRQCAQRKGLKVVKVRKVSASMESSSSSIGRRRRGRPRRPVSHSSSSCAKLSSSSSSSDSEYSETLTESYSQFKSRRRQLRKARIASKSGATEPLNVVHIHRLARGRRRDDRDVATPSRDVVTPPSPRLSLSYRAGLVEASRSRSVATPDRLLYYKPPTGPCERRRTMTTTTASLDLGKNHRVRRRSGSCHTFNPDERAGPLSQMDSKEDEVLVTVHMPTSFRLMDDKEEEDEEEEVEFDEELVLKTCHDFIHDYDHRRASKRRDQGSPQRVMRFHNQFGRNRSQSLTLVEKSSLTTSIEPTPRRRTITTATTAMANGNNESSVVLPKSILKKSSEDLLDLEHTTRTPVPILKHRATSSGSLLTRNNNSSSTGVNNGHGILKRKTSSAIGENGLRLLETTYPFVDERATTNHNSSSGRRSEHIRIRSPSPLSSSSSSLSMATPTTPKSILRSRTNSSEDSRRRSSLASSPLLDECLPIQGILKQRRHSLAEGLLHQSKTGGGHGEDTQQGILKRRASSAVSGSHTVDNVLGILKKHSCDVTNVNNNCGMDVKEDSRVRPILKKSSTVASEDDGEQHLSSSSLGPTKSILKTRKTDDSGGADNGPDVVGFLEASLQHTIKPILRRASRDDDLNDMARDYHETQVWSAPVSCVSTPLKLRLTTPSMQPSSSSSMPVSPRRFSSGCVEVARLYHRVSNFDNEEDHVVIVARDDANAAGTLTNEPQIQTSTFSIDIEETPLRPREANENDRDGRDCSCVSSSTEDSSLSSEADMPSSSNFAAVLDSVPSGRDSPSGRDLLCSEDNNSDVHEEEEEDDDYNNNDGINDHGLNDPSASTWSSSRVSEAAPSYTASQRRPVIPLSRVKLSSDDPELASKLEIIADAAEAIRRKMSLSGRERLAPDDSEPLLPAFLKPEH